MSEPHIVGDLSLDRKNGKTSLLQAYRDAQFLDHLKHELNTQDNACTADPIFIVYQKRRQYGLDTQWSDENIVWIMDSCEASPEDADMLEKQYQETGDEPGDWTRTAFVDIDRFVTCCFTRKGAEDYIKVNGHNLKKPYIYVECLWRNAEMKRLRNVLMGESDERDS